MACMERVIHGAGIRGSSRAAGDGDRGEPAAPVAARDVLLRQDERSLPGTRPSPCRLRRNDPIVGEVLARGNVDATTHTVPPPTRRQSVVPGTPGGPPALVRDQSSGRSPGTAPPRT